MQSFFFIHAHFYQGVERESVPSDTCLKGPLDMCPMLSNKPTAHVSDGVLQCTMVTEQSSRTHILHALALSFRSRAAYLVAHDCTEYMSDVYIHLENNAWLKQVPASRGDGK